MMISPKVIISIIFATYALGLLLSGVKLCVQWHRVEKLAAKKEKTDNEFDNEMWLLAFEAIMMVFHLIGISAIILLSKWVEGVVP